MKFTRSKRPEVQIIQAGTGGTKVKLPPWKVLIVDDEPDIHTLARLNLKNFEFSGRSLQFFESLSAEEAKAILFAEPDIAVAFIDVVMETDDAGLKLVEFIRHELHNSLMRLIIRTGQPGLAPEKYVIDNYDIDDYKDKTELTAQKLYTAMRSALKSFRDLNTIDANRKGLRKILDSTPALYYPQSIQNFFASVLIQIIDLCKDNFIATINSGLVVTSSIKNEQQPVLIQAGSGRFERFQDNEEVQTIAKVCANKLLGKTDDNNKLPSEALLVPLRGQNMPIGFVYLEDGRQLMEADQDLIHIMANQCTSALENLQLYLDLEEANRRSLNLLAVAEQARTMAETANRAKSTFLAKMSHELRTPLNAILGYNEILGEELEDIGCDQDVMPYLKKIKIAGDKLLGIISDILDVSQIQTDQIKLNLVEFAVNDVVKEVVSAIHPTIQSVGNRLIVEQDDALGMFYADWQKVKQILWNLLSNATKFTVQGTITFKIKRKYETFSGRDWLRFEVSDTGIGIAPEEMDRIFEAFSQVDDSSTRLYEGAGLGLAITQYFCQIMGGVITVKSKLDQGSTFTVRLPANVAVNERN